MHKLKSFKLNTNRETCDLCESDTVHFATHYAQIGWGDSQKWVPVCEEYIKNNKLSVLMSRTIPDKG